MVLNITPYVLHICFTDRIEKQKKKTSKSTNKRQFKQVKQ